MGIKPFEQLADAINRLLPGLEAGFQFVAGQGFDVGQHGRNLNCATGETKRVISAYLKFWRKPVSNRL